MMADAFSSPVVCGRPDWQACFAPSSCKRVASVKTLR